MQVVVVPAAITVRTPGLSVDFPLAPGLYVPVRSGISMGAPVLMTSLLSGPSTVTVPRSAPPSLTSMDGLTCSAGMSIGLSMTDLLNFTVRSYEPPFFLALIRTGDVAFLSPMGVLQA